MTRRKPCTLIPFAGGAAGLGSRLVEDSVEVAPSPAPLPPLRSSDLTITIRVEFDPKKLAAQVGKVVRGCEAIQAESQGGGWVQSYRSPAPRPPGRRTQKYAT